MPDLTAAFNWAVTVCEDPNVRYNQSYRNAGKDPDGYTCYDCSSFINYALLAGGWSTPGYAPNSNAFTTYTMIKVLLDNGFVEVSASGDIKPGDIGWNNAHTEMAYSSGTNGKAVFMGAHGRNGVAGENQVSIGNSSGNRNATRSFDKIFRYEGTPVEESFSIHVIAAIAGNMDAESTLSPGTWESLVARNWDSQYSNNTGGYGLGQWTNVGTPRGRLWGLYSWLSASGYSADSGDGQAAYVIEENYWTPRSGYPFSNLTEFLNSSSTDIDMLTGAWNVCWEGIPLQPSRYALSRHYYDVISTRMSDSSIVSWVSKNAFLSQPERDNNAVMLYRALRGKVEPGDSTEVDPGYNSGDLENNPEIPNWFNMFAMALGGSSNHAPKKITIRRSRQ